MSKKIHELAKELNVTSKRLMEKLEEIQIHPKSHMSTLEEDELSKLYKHIGIVRHDGEEKSHSGAETEARHETHDAAARRNAPRIIRKTEVIIRDTVEPDLREDRKKQEPRRGSGIVRSSESNDGLLGGYTRGQEAGTVVRKRPKSDQPEGEVEAQAADREPVDAIRQAERHHAKPVEEVLSIKRVATKAERDEYVHAQAQAQAEREAARAEQEMSVREQPAPAEFVSETHHEASERRHAQDAGRRVKPDAAERVAEVVQNVQQEVKAEQASTRQENTAEAAESRPVREASAEARPQEPVRPQDMQRAPIRPQDMQRQPVRPQDMQRPPVRPQDLQRQQMEGRPPVRPQDLQRQQQEGRPPVRPQDLQRQQMEGRPPVRPQDLQRQQMEGRPPVRPQDLQRQQQEGRPPVRPQDMQRPPVRPQDMQRPPVRPQDMQRPPYDPNRPRPQYDGNRPPYDPNRPRPQYDGNRPPYDPNRPRPQYDGNRPPYDPNRPRPQYDGNRPPYDPNRPRPQGGFGGPRPGFGGGMDKDADLRNGPPRSGPRTGRPMGAKPDTPAVAEKAPVRGERRTFTSVDKQKNEKNDTRQPARTTGVPAKGAAAGSFKKKIDIVGQKGNVSDMMSDEFVIDVFYDDNDETMNAKRAEKRIRRQRMERMKHIPPKAVLTEITIGESITVKDLAEALKKTAADVIKRLFMMGITATQNQELDFDTASLLADEYKVAVKKAVVVSAEDILFDESADTAEELETRAPVVVVMGHVDHGKTSLLDAIRSANIAEGEAGGITQHIGAYTVNLHGRDITFLDTPGHEAFTAMRKRGAQATDIAILVVAADDGVMPQTIEAIHHAKAANVAIIVAINKIDKPNANMDRVKQELSQHGIIIEEWGGDVPAVPVSAKQRVNIDQLLEMVLLQADILELKAAPNKQAKGMVIEARLDKNKGPIATLLVQRGTLHVGDLVISGSSVGRIRAMTNDKGRRIKDAGPSIPVEITGMPDVPEAGELFYAVEDERVAKQLAEKRYQEMREKQIGSRNKVTLDDLFSQIKAGNVKDLNLIIKADVQGSVEALKSSLIKLSNEEVKVKVIHDAVGGITESDVSLAEVSNAIIIGFNVRPGANVQAAVEASGVDMRLYRVIYDAINDMEKAMKGMLAPTFKEVVDGHIEIRQLFKVSNVGTIAGCYVLDGKVQRSSEVRIVRDGIVVHEGKMASLKRFKDDVKEVSYGYECGLMLEKFNDIKEGDVVEAFHQEQVVV